jgi:hypothetical protein
MDTFNKNIIKYTKYNIYIYIEFKIEIFQILSDLFQQKKFHLHLLIIINMIYLFKNKNYFFQILKLFFLQIHQFGGDLFCE